MKMQSVKGCIFFCDVFSGVQKKKLFLYILVMSSDGVMITDIETFLYICIESKNYMLN